MPTPVVYPSAKQILNVGVETTQGTAVAPTASLLLEKIEPDPKPTWLEDKGMRGSMTKDYGLIQGPIVEELTVEGPAFFDNLGFLIRNVLGDYNGTGVSAPFTHAMSLLNTGTAQPSSLTGIHWQGIPSATSFARQYGGICFSELVLSGNAESSLVKLTGKATAYPSTVAVTAPALIGTPVSPQAAWRTAMGLAGPASGGTQVKTIEEWEVTIARELKPKFTLQNAQSPFVIQRGELKVTGKLKFTVPADESNNVLYLLNNTQPQLQILIDNGVVGANQLRLTLDIFKAAYETAKPNFGTESVGVDVTFRAIANTTNVGPSGGFSPITATLINAVTLNTY